MKVKYKYLLFGCLFAVAGQSCTDLTENTYDVVPTDEFGGTAGQQAALIGPIYNNLGGYFDKYWQIDVSTDEAVIPTRGGDWGDGGKWVRMHEHKWETNEDLFNNIWKMCYESITAINSQLGAQTDPGLIAELKALRAFYHYIAMDHFGNVIIADQLGGTTPTQKTSKEMYTWIESELLAVYPNLSETAGGAYYGRMNKYVVDMILAKLYLNAEIYTGTPQWQKAITYSDHIIASKKYSLAADFFSVFSITNQKSPEIILATPFDKDKRTGFEIQRYTLNYLNQLTYSLSQSTYNGVATTASFYRSFADGDLRKNMWLVGQQYTAAGEPINDQGVPFAYTIDIPALVMPAGVVARNAGVRSVKYEIQKNNPSGSQDNDFVVFRLGDVYLMRAEANYRLGKTAAALEDVNVIRTRAGVPNFTTLTDDILLAERGREMAWEYHRRQDLIRFKQFTKAWDFKSVTAATRTLFPIPAVQIGLNPNLKQNPGYN
ncbi:RagB/SusD family nutrient uptake outer membrane protein [Dyadobacter sp. NIV53]|uniref:RagB/SusD family nutrient uptake outer membrane protein n=1 Tax=Dyadobacter sp. NIV53 TaxID=2861765 RepID=UPI001C8709A5|nr:RagB/SusD family nutrient uptake outer membrane protein [Dyadobacter sp. NIV53]